jgi:hypothetical protein
VGQIPTYLGSGAYYRDRCTPLTSEEAIKQWCEDTKVQTFSGSSVNAKPVTMYLAPHGFETVARRSSSATLHWRLLQSVTSDNDDRELVE